MWCGQETVTYYNVPGGHLSSGRHETDDKCTQNILGDNMRDKGGIKRNRE
jgi:hypothetical protein